MSEISIILIRHGEASAAWGDDPDPGLSERGISQASKLTTIKDLDQLDGYDFISSPKSRAVMTATPLIKKYNKKIDVCLFYSEQFFVCPLYLNKFLSITTVTLIWMIFQTEPLV